VFSSSLNLRSPPLAAEYRRLPGVRPGVESPEFRLALRVMSQRREVALELSEELSVDVEEFNSPLICPKAQQPLAHDCARLLALPRMNSSDARPIGRHGSTAKAVRNSRRAGVSVSESEPHPGTGSHPV